MAAIQRRVLFTLALLLSGCSVAGTGTGTGASDELRAACGSAVFPTYPIALVAADQLTAPAKAAFEELLVSPDGEKLTYRDWFIVEEDSDGFVLFGSPNDSNYPYGQIVFESKDDGYEPIKWDSCNLEIKLDGFGAATTVLDPGSNFGPEVTELSILMTERACAGGGALNGREVINTVVETEDSILLVSMIQSNEGFSNCPGNDPVAWTIALDAPLGDRTIFDAGDLPPTELTQPVQGE